MLSTQITVSQIIQMLTQNPGVAIFSLQTSDYPNGVTRAALQASLQAQLGPTNSGNFDPTTGVWNSHVYAPGILVNGGSTPIPPTPAANMNAAGSSILPVITPNGASAAGANIGTIVNPSEIV